MCGIIGSLNSNIIQENSVNNLLNNLSHRGPDQRGFYQKKNIFLGHLRLTIQDTQSGEQPMYFQYKSKSYVFIYNGETYNVEELKCSLKDKGIEFTTTTDTEVVFKYLVVEGVESGVSKLNGMFSFCLFNESDGISYLARDRFGIKPLYYTLQQNSLYFASELKSLMSFDGLKKQLNKDAVSQYFSFAIPLLPYTFYKNVYELEPATLLTFNASTHKTSFTRYWNSNSYETDTSISYNDAKTHLDNLLNDVIKDQLASDVGYSTFLSGGIDSSLVTALTNKYSSSKFNSYTVSFDDTAYDELPYAKQVASSCKNVSHKIINSETFKFDTNLIDNIISHVGQPFGDSSCIPTYFISKEVAKHEKMVLSGDGGDELFFGYESFDWHQKIQGLKKIPQSLRKLISYLSPLIKKPDTYRQINKALKYSFKDNHDLMICMSSILDIVDFQELQCNSPMLWLQDLKTFYSNQKDSIYLKKQQFSLNYSLNSDMLRKVDRMSMANSIEVRVPLLDNRLVDFALQLPLHFHFTKTDKKKLLKDVAASYLPKSVIAHKKWGFCIPLHNAMPVSFIEENKSLLLDQDLIDKKFINTFLDYKKHTTSDVIKHYSQYTVDHTIWMLILLFRWIKNEGISY